MTEAERTPAIEPRRRWVVVLPVLVAVCVWGVDQLVKAWVLRELPVGKHIEVFGEALQWVHVKNPGAAFSFGVNMTWIFTVISMVVLIVIVVLVRRLRSRGWAVFFGMLLGGVLGNLTDRLFREPGFAQGHVIDFIYTPWMMPAVYNIADIAICSAMGLMVILTFMGIHIDGSKSSKKTRGSAEDDTAHAQQGAS